MIDVKNQVFRDVSKTGKDRKWRERKLRNIGLAERLEKLGYRSFNNVYQCAEVLKFRERPDGTKRLYQSFFCKNKLCALCSWRRSMKYSYQASQIVTEARKRYPKARFLFLTLTIRNVSGDELKSALSKMTEGFRRLMMYAKVDKNILGFLRATEVTYSRTEKNYHPHLHVLLMVRPAYFQSKKDYIKQEEWSELWQKAMKLDYLPIVDIRAIKDKTGKGLDGAILETAKYPVKPFDVEADKNGNVVVYTEDEKLQITDDLLTGLERKRQIGFGKLFKEIKKELEFDDIEDGDLIQTGEEKSDCVDGKEIVAIWNWERKNYFVR